MYQTAKIISFLWQECLLCWSLLQSGHPEMTRICWTWVFWRVDGTRRLPKEFSLYINCQHVDYLQSQSLGFLIYSIADEMNLAWVKIFVYIIVKAWIINYWKKLCCSVLVAVIFKCILLCFLFTFFNCGDHFALMHKPPFFPFWSDRS